ADAITLLKRIRKFSMTQDIGARVAVYIFNRINVAIAKGAWYLDDGTIVGDTLIIGGPVSVAPDFSSSLVMKKVSKTIGLLDAVAKINDLQCYVLTYAFIASRLQCVALRIKLLRHVGIVAPGSTFDDALCMFNNSIEIDFLCNPNNASDWLHVVLIYGLGRTMNDICFRSEISTSKEVDIRLGGGSFPLTRTGMVDFVSGRAVTEAAQRKRIKYEAKCADIGYGCLSFSFSSFGELKKDVVTLLKRIRKFSMAQDIGARAAVHILNRISFSIAKEVLFKGFCWSYRDHVVSCASIIGIKLRHNVVRYTLVDICYRSGMSDFVSGWAVIDIAQRKRSKYIDKCAAIRYGFPLCSFSSLRELEEDVVSLLKRIQEISMTQDIGAYETVYIFCRIGFSIAKGVGAQIVSRLPSNLLQILLS
nr:hypothetical protein [Tanacetum cinerariifolium]